MLRVWNALLVCATFILSIFGTYLTRSGVVSSVHAFGSGDVGQWFLYFLFGLIAITVFLLVFLAPFILLLGARPKRNTAMRFGVALVSLAGLWLERYLEIVPSINHGAGPAIGLPELGVTALFAGVFLLAYGWFGSRFPMVSPRLAAETIEAEHH